MAIPFLNNINLTDNQLLNAKLQVSSSAPTSAPGQIYFNTNLSENRVRVHNGTEFKAVAWYDDIPATIVESLTLNNSTFITLSNSGTSTDPSIAASLSASGTPSSSTYLRGDNTWAALPNDPTITLTGEVTGTGTTSISTTVANSVLDVANFNASAIVTASEGIENNDNDTTLPTSAAVKAYVDASVVGGLVYQGGYNAATNTPNLDATPIAGIKKGWTYTVTADGLFFTEQVRVGDVIIAEIDAPTTLADWTTVQNNIDVASASQIGIGNVAAGTGISISYNGSGTATITNTETNSANSYAATISDTATITHSLNTRDVIVQLYDAATFETVYADVDRISTTQVTITFASTPANSIRVLVQKIG